MGKSILDPEYKPDQYLLLMLIDGEARFIGVSQKTEVDSRLASAQPGEAVLVEFMTTASSGNLRHETLGQAIKCKAGKNDVGIQPAVPPNGLHPDLAKVWWNAPRDSQFPDFK